MNLRQLEAFRATIRCGSVTAAAREMNLSQPSVSRLLAGLEESAGFPLFARAGRGLEPTEEGLTFLEGVESMYVGIERMRELARTILAARGGTIVVGTIQSVAGDRVSPGGGADLPRAPRCALHHAFAQHPRHRRGGAHARIRPRRGRARIRP